MASPLDLCSTPARVVAKDGTDWVKKGFFKSRRRAKITLRLHDAQDEPPTEEPQAPPRLKFRQVTFVPQYILTIGDLWANGIPPRYAPLQPCNLDEPICGDCIDVFFNDFACDLHTKDLALRRKAINARMEHDFKAFLFSQLSRIEKSPPLSSYAFL